jgi:hypothetical protein
MRKTFCWHALPILVVLGFVACATTQDRSTPPRASGDEPVGPVTVNQAEPGTIPVGQEIDVRLRQTLSSDTASVEDRFEATTVVDLMQEGHVLVPAGSVIRGVVSNVDEADRLDRDSSLTLSFDRLEVEGRGHEIRGTASQVFKSGGIRDEAPRAGVGAGVGGIVGGILGGVEGAVLGAVIGAGGAIVATDGTDITLPAGSIIRVRMDSPVRLG